MEKISAVYKIVNTVTNDCYVGSSKDVKKRWADHKCPSTWKNRQSSKLYQDMQKYGVDKFRFQILCPVEPEHLKEVEQELIEMIQPTYNNNRANGWNVERHKESHRKAVRKYIRKYSQSDKGKEVHRKGQIKYQNQICSYNGETLTLNALTKRFFRAGIRHPNLEAKKFLLDNNN